jgi:hypothetical protein
MSLQSEADAILHDAVASRDVPGVVAAATTLDQTIYEGAFGERVLGSGIAMKGRAGRCSTDRKHRGAKIARSAGRLQPQSLPFR